MKNRKLLFWAAVDSLGIFVYVSAVALFMFNAPKFFGEKDNFTMPIIFLLLFIISATITSSLFLGRPIYLYLNGFKKEGIKLFFYTLVFLIIILSAVFIFARVVFLQKIF